jgi:hypothetical protein
MADAATNKPESPEQLTARFTLINRNAKIVCKACTFARMVVTQRQTTNVRHEVHAFLGSDKRVTQKTVDGLKSVGLAPGTTAETGRPTKAFSRPAGKSAHRKRHHHATVVSSEDR